MDFLHIPFCRVQHKAIALSPNNPRQNYSEGITKPSETFQGIVTVFVKETLHQGKGFLETKFNTHNKQLLDNVSCTLPNLLHQRTIKGPGFHRLHNLYIPKLRRCRFKACNVSNPH
jgi:hypothetical protein